MHLVQGNTRLFTTVFIESILKCPLVVSKLYYSAFRQGKINGKQKKADFFVLRLSALVVTHLRS